MRRGPSVAPGSGRLFWFRSSLDACVFGLVTLCVKLLRPVIYAFYVLAALVIIQGLYSLLEGVRHHAYVLSSLDAPRGSFQPRAAVIAPCKGVEPGLEANVRSLFDQDYPDYEIVFAIASPADPSRATVERVMAEHRERHARLVIGGEAEGRGEKVNNLLSAIPEVSDGCEALVFVDSDARVHRRWLRDLLSRLDEPSIGATTGYRWYLPQKGGFWSALLSAWNGSVATTLGSHARNFAWGGSTAILRDVFDRIDVRRCWENAVSDDYALTRAVQLAGLTVAYVPSCLLPTRQDASLLELLEFTTRQVVITRVYRPNVWAVGLASQLLFGVVFFGGIVLALTRLVQGESSLGVYALLIAIMVLGSLKGVVRLKSAGASIPEHRREVLRLWWMFALLWPLVSLLFLYNFARSAATRRITWRGIVYELRSSNETVVMRR